MLISLQKGFEQLPRTDDLFHCMDHLLMVFDEGKHMLVAPRAVVPWLMGWKKLNHRKKAIYALRDGGFEQKAWRQQVCVEVQVSPRDDAVFSREDLQQRTVFEVPWSWFNDSARVQVSVLLVEADDDAVILPRAARAWGARHRDELPGARCVLDAEATGGGNIKARYRRVAQNGRMVLAVVDSDKAGPDEAMGSTARGVSKEHKTMGDTDGVFDLHIMKARELENLIPAALLEASLPKDKQHALSRWRRAECLFPSGRYLDQKEGHRVEGSAPLPKLGEYLSHVADHLEQGRVTAQKLAEFLFSQDDGTWDGLGHRIFSWGCAGRRVRL